MKNIVQGDRSMGGYSQKTSHIYWNTGIEFKYNYNFFEFLFETNEMTKVPGASVTSIQDCKMF